MKKRMIVGFSLALFLLAGMLHAQARPGEISIGGRAGALIGFHSLNDDFDDSDTSSLVNFNFALYGNYAISERLFFQAGLNFMINQGMEEKFSYVEFGDRISEEIKMTYSSLDIPVLLKYCFLGGPTQFGLLGGLHLSIPLGDMEAEMKISGGGMTITGSGKSPIDGPTFGLTAGLFTGIPAGPGRFVGDMRFIFDFNDITLKEEGVTYDIAARRGLAITVGYEFSF